MINNYAAWEMRQKQLERIKTNVGPYDKSHPDLDVGIPTNIPGEEPHWAPGTPFPWITFS